MPSIYELKRLQKPLVTSAKGPGRQIIAGDYQSAVELSQQYKNLSPDEVDEQIRRFFEPRQP
jgi:hypothetical protein